MHVSFERWRVGAIAFALLGAACAIGEESTAPPPGEPIHTATYRETTAGESMRLVAREWRTDGGLFLESVSSTGDRHVVLVDDRLVTRSWRYHSSNTRVLAARRGATVSVSGRVEGASVDGTVEIRETPWIQSIERSLREFVLGGAEGDRLRFSVVQPDNLSARTLQAQIMGDEVLEIEGRAVQTRRIRISLPGIGALFWRSSYWYRLSDGLFVQSRVTRGPPGTPETLVILTGDSGRAP